MYALEIERLSQGFVVSAKSEDWQGTLTEMRFAYTSEEEVRAHLETFFKYMSHREKTRT